MTHSALTLSTPLTHSFVKRTRIDSIDLIRGIVLILMALDHSRHFFSNVLDPLSLTEPMPLVFFTRWITNFCAPVFIFLAGVSAYLFSSRPDTTLLQTSHFLLTRGLWFIIVDWTLIFFIWTFYLTPFHLSIQIFSAIGVSMVILSLLVFLPRWLILAVSVALIFGHNLLDSITATQFKWPEIWIVLHENNSFYLFDHLKVVVGYPLIPWMGVMSLGYVLGPLFKMDETYRNKIFIGLGILLTLLFIAIRWNNGYGDPHPWQTQSNSLVTLMSFLKCQKYPPSLCYLLSTLGPIFILMGILGEKFNHFRVSQLLIRFGKVPFFYYVLHLPFILGLGFLIAAIKTHGDVAALSFPAHLSEFGYGLPVVYLVWAFTICVLYYPCCWYGKFKSKSKHWVLSYL